MGMSCLLQARKTDAPVTFMAPSFAKKMTSEDLRFRKPNLDDDAENFWYLELGGDRDSIRDTETIRDELLALAFGIWDYIKNSGEYHAENWQLDFVGFLPGKRESRRMIGDDHLMTQPEVSNGGVFPDVVAYGGWPLDDHDPAGFYYNGHPCVQIPTPPVYGIPYRCLYSGNIENLYFAGRNISMTHAAMSSARVMATCALLGQAVGTAASVALAHCETPREVYVNHLSILQKTLLENDCMLPGIKRQVGEDVKKARLIPAEAECVRDGEDRLNAYVVPENGWIEYVFDEPVYIQRVRLIFDSDLDRMTLPGSACERRHAMRANVCPDSPVMRMPGTLVRSYTLECVTDESKTVCLSSEADNRKRLVIVDVGRTVRTLRLRPLMNWDGGKQGRVFSFDFS